MIKIKSGRVQISIYQLKISNLDTSRFFFLQLKNKNLDASRFQFWTRPDFKFSMEDMKIWTCPNINYGLQILSSRAKILLVNLSFGCARTNPVLKCAKGWNCLQWAEYKIWANSIQRLLRNCQCMKALCMHAQCRDHILNLGYG